MPGIQISLFFLLPFVLIAKATAAFPASIFPSLVDTLIRRLLIQASFLVDVIPAFFSAKGGEETAQNPESGKQLFCILFTPRQLPEIFVFDFVELNLAIGID